MLELPSVWSRFRRPPCGSLQPSNRKTFVTTIPPKVPELSKSLITERDLAAVPNGETRLRITKTALLTPLANDEARRRGIRIERTIA